MWRELSVLTVPTSSARSALSTGTSSRYTITTYNKIIRPIELYLFNSRRKHHNEILNNLFHDTDFICTGVLLTVE